VRFILPSRSDSMTWLNVAADEAQRAVPTDAAAKVGRDAAERAAGPAARKPKAVVETTRAERRAFESSATFFASVACCPVPHDGGSASASSGLPSVRSAAASPESPASLLVER